MTTSTQSRFPEKWAQRFAFFDQHGAPNTASFKTALATLGHADKIKMNANIWAFFFGPIYLCLLGLWKKALVLTAVAGSALVLAAALNLPGFVQFGLGFGSSVLFALCTNYAYYLKCIKGKDGWNAFEGLRW